MTRCPCGGGRLVPVPTCPACHEQWIDHATAVALDAATEPHVIEERRARIAKRQAAPAPRAETPSAITSCDECADGSAACALRVGPHREPMVLPCPVATLTAPKEK